MTSKYSEISRSLFYQKRLSILVTFGVALCLLFSGMRVPDIARPHRPKPSQKAIFESPVKASQEVVNKSVLICAIISKPIELQTLCSYRSEFVFAFDSSELPPLFPNSSRAPPFYLS